MALQAARRLFTVDEYYQMTAAGILHEDDRVELIAGEIIQMAAIGSRHAGCVNRLTQSFVLHVAGRAIVTIQNPNNQAGRLGPLTDLAAQVARFGRLGFLNAVQMALDGVFERFPTLKLFFAETQIGWLPWAYEMADIRYERHRHWAQEVLEWQPLPKKPTDYLKEHILWGFQQDSVVVRLRDLMGVDKLIWATDFPHQESEYPHSHAVVAKNFAGVPADETYQMVAGNVIRFFHLETSAK